MSQAILELAKQGYSTQATEQHLPRSNCRIALNFLVGKGRLQKLERLPQCDERHTTKPENRVLLARSWQAALPDRLARRRSTSTAVLASGAQGSISAKDHS